jgi:hypothetical protein
MKNIDSTSALTSRRKSLGIFFISFLVLFILPLQSFAIDYYGVNGTTNVATATLTCWGTNTDGTGTNPTTFNNAADKFIIPVGCTMTLSAIITLNGATLDVFGTLIGATSPVKGTGAFILEAGGTLKTSNTNGVAASSGTSGAVQTTTKTFNAGANYEYNGTAAQTANNPTTANNIIISNTGGIVSITNSITALSGTFTVNPNATLNMGLKTLKGSGSFLLGAGATLKTSNTNATPITEAVGQLTGTKTFDPTANYTFSAAQTVDQSITEISTANNIEINITGTPANLTLSTPIRVNGVLTLTAGTLTLGDNNLAITNPETYQSNPKILLTGTGRIVDKTTDLNMIRENLSIYTSHNQLFVKGTSAGEMITVFNAKGQTITQVMATNNLTTINLKKGFYLLQLQSQSNNGSFKVVIN